MDTTDQASHRHAFFFFFLDFLNLGSDHLIFMGGGRFSEKGPAFSVTHIQDTVNSIVRFVVYMQIKRHTRVADEKNILARIHLPRPH